MMECFPSTRASSTFEKHLGERKKADAIQKKSRNASPPVRIRKDRQESGKDRESSSWKRGEGWRKDESCETSAEEAAAAAAVWKRLYRPDLRRAVNHHCSSHAPPRSVSPPPSPSSSSFIPLFHFKNPHTTITAIQHHKHYHLLAILTSENEIYVCGTQHMDVLGSERGGGGGSDDESFAPPASLESPFSLSLASSPFLSSMTGHSSTSLSTSLLHEMIEKRKRRLRSGDPAHHIICLDALPSPVSQLCWAPWRSGISLLVVCPGKGIYFYRYAHRRWTRDEAVVKVGEEEIGMQLPGEYYANPGSHLRAHTTSYRGGDKVKSDDMRGVGGGDGGGSTSPLPLKRGMWEDENQREKRSSGHGMATPLTPSSTPPPCGVTGVTPRSASCAWIQQVHFAPFGYAFVACCGLGGGGGGMKVFCRQGGRVRGIGPVVAHRQGLENEHSSCFSPSCTPPPLSFHSSVSSGGMRSNQSGRVGGGGEESRAVGTGGRSMKKNTQKKLAQRSSSLQDEEEEGEEEEEPGKHSPLRLSSRVDKEKKQKQKGGVEERIELKYSNLARKKKAQRENNDEQDWNDGELEEEEEREVEEMRTSDGEVWLVFSPLKRRASKKKGGKRVQWREECERRNNRNNNSSRFGGRNMSSCSSCRRRMGGGKGRSPVPPPQSRIATSSLQEEKPEGKQRCRHRDPHRGIMDDADRDKNAEDEETEEEMEEDEYDETEEMCVCVAWSTTGQWISAAFLDGGIHIMSVEWCKELGCEETIIRVMPCYRTRLPYVPAKLSPASVLDLPFDRREVKKEDNAKTTSGRGGSKRGNTSTRCGRNRPSLKEEDWMRSYSQRIPVTAGPISSCHQLSWAPLSGRSFMLLLAVGGRGGVLFVFQRPPGVSECQLYKREGEWEEGQASRAVAAVEAPNVGGQEERPFSYPMPGGSDGLSSSLHLSGINKRQGKLFPSRENSVPCRPSTGVPNSVSPIGARSPLRSPPSSSSSSSSFPHSPASSPGGEERDGRYPSRSSPRCIITSPKGRSESGTVPVPRGGSSSFTSSLLPPSASHSFSSPCALNVPPLPSSDLCLLSPAVTAASFHSSLPPLHLWFSIPVHCGEVLRAEWNSAGTEFITSHKDSSVHVWRVVVRHAKRRPLPGQWSRHLCLPVSDREENTPAGPHHDHQSSESHGASPHLHFFSSAGGAACVLTPPPPTVSVRHVSVVYPYHPVR